MAKKGIFRRIADRITAPIVKTTTAVKDVVAAPFTKKPTKRSSKKKQPAPTPTPAEKPRPTPKVAREMLSEKLSDTYFLRRKFNAATMNKKIDKMTDAQVYAALDMSDDDIETAVRAKPGTATEWADPDDPTVNVLWYHSSEAMLG